MRTRSSTRANGQSPGREHALPPPTRKPRGPKKTKPATVVEDAPAKPSGSETLFTGFFNALFISRNKAVLLEWLYVFFLLLFLDAMMKATPAPIPKPW